MITKEDFWKTINDVHPNIAVNSIESIRELSKVISSVAFQMLPDRLYQYRSFSSDSDSFDSCSHNVTHLINDEIWGTKISKENDQYEIFPYFGTQEMKQERHFVSKSFIFSINFQILVPISSIRSSSSEANSLALSIASLTWGK